MTLVNPFKSDPGLCNKAKSLIRASYHVTILDGNRDTIKNVQSLYR